MKTLSTRSLLIPNYKQESCLSDLITQKLNHRNPISLFPPSLNHTEKLRSTSLFLAYFSFNFVQKKKSKQRADSPGPGSFASRGPAGSSRSWWGRGCLGACRATAWAAAPCPAGPGACVALCRRWDDPCGGTRGPWAGHKTKDLLPDSTQMHTWNLYIVHV